MEPLDLTPYCSLQTESNDRVGPPPPLPPANADPEYEVIDVANQQYSNTPPPIPIKSAGRFLAFSFFFGGQLI